MRTNRQKLIDAIFCLYENAMNSTVLSWLLIASIGVYHWQAVVEELPLMNALGGFSPIDWLNHINFPENFTRDWPNGEIIYKNSSFMQIYRLVWNNFQIGPEAMMPVIIALEFLLVALFSWLLSRTISPDAPKIVAAITVLILMSSTARNVNLARFGLPYYPGTYYNVADFCRFVGIVHIIKRRYIAGAMFLAVGFTVHPLLGLTGAVFSAATIIVDRKRPDYTSFLLPLILFSFISIFWIVSTMGSDSAFQTDIPSDLWFSYAKLFNFHWFPFEWNVYITDYSRRVLPFLIMMLLYVHYLLSEPKLRLIDRQLLAGNICAGLIVVTGWVISITTPNITLVKLALHRANDLITVIIIVYIARSLWRELGSRFWYRRLIAGALLVSPFETFRTPGFPLYYVIILVLVPTIVDVFKGHKKVRSTTIFSIAAAIIMLISVAEYQGYGQQWNAYIYAGKNWYQYISVLTGSGIFFFLLVLVPMAGAKASRMAALIIVTLTAFSGINNLKMSSSRKEYAKSYLEVQMWVKENTPIDSLFALDPTFSYGWKAYSQRSSFGTLRSWLHTSWLYDSDFKLYSGGIGRTRAMGIEPENYIVQRNEGWKEYVRMRTDIAAAFNGMDDQSRLELTSKYDIDYLVYDQAKKPSPTTLPIAYKNEHFIVLAPN